MARRIAEMYGVLGDEVNLAARLMERSTPGQVLVSGRLRRAAGEGIEWQELPPIKLKGKADPVEVSALVRMGVKAAARVVEAQYGLELVGRKHIVGLIGPNGAGKTTPST